MSVCILFSAVQRVNTNTHHVGPSSETAMGRAISGTSDAGVLVGSFELTGEAKVAVIAIALSGALRSVTSALLYLWGRTGRPSPLTDAHGATNISNRTSTGAPESPISTHTSVATEPAKPTQRGTPSLANLSPEDTGALLDILQCTMQAMRQDINSCR